MSEEPLDYSLISGGITAPLGFKAAGVTAGIKESGKPDLALVFSAKAAVAAVVTTQNSAAAAPVQLSREIVQDKGPKHAVVINSGNANACTGTEGMDHAKAMVEAAARGLSIPVSSVIVNSTGIIGVPLPVDTVVDGINMAIPALASDAGHEAAVAIMTTDIVSKEIAVEVDLGGRFGGHKIRIGAMAKGSGMIAPNMATTIAVITTDALLTHEALQGVLSSSADKSFNQISVDGCESTNDMMVAMANGASSGEESVDAGTGRAFGKTSRRTPKPMLSQADPELEVFAKAFDFVCIELAKMVAVDGEGATKLIEVSVVGAEDIASARAASMSVVRSDLVKTAARGSDPNWGRIVAAIGSTSVAVSQESMSVSIQGTSVCRGFAVCDFDETAVSNMMNDRLLFIDIDLGVGDSSSVAWGCDLTEEYVHINSDYRT